MSDKESQIFNNISFTSISVPKYAWRCQFSPGTYYQVEDGKQPNMFHRFMHNTFFGFKWSRIDD